LYRFKNTGGSRDTGLGFKSLPANVHLRSSQAFPPSLGRPGLGRVGRSGVRECSAPPHTTPPCPPRTGASPREASLMPPSSPSPPQPCARPLTRGIPETPRMPNAAPHVCACGGRPLVRGRVWRHRGARARDACVPPSVGVTEPTPPRGATPTSRSRLTPPGHRTARGGHTPERDVGPAGLPRSALQSRPMRG
jgi:hypothetical protein